MRVARSGAPGRTTGMRPFHVLLVGQVASALGDWMATVALMALVLELTGSATAVGGVLVLRLAPTVMAGPLAARLVRRWSRRRIMLAMDAVRVPAALLLPWITELWWIYLWAVVLEVGGMVFLPARDASIPDLLEPDENLAVANGVVLGSSYGMIPIGAGAFALVAALSGGDADVEAARLVFLVNALTFVASFLAISRLPELGVSAVQSGSETPGTFRDALRLPIVRHLVSVAGVVAAGLGALFSVGIIWVRDVLEASDTEFGLLVACFGVGAGLGLLALRSMPWRGLATVRLLLAAQGGVIAAMSLAPVIGLALLGAVGFGAATAMVLALSMEVLQSHTDAADRLLAFTAFHVVIRGGLALAAIASGVADDVLGPTDWPILGTLESTQVVLLSSGLLVLSVALFNSPIRTAVSGGTESRA